VPVPGLAILNLYQLTGTPEAFAAAVQALAARVRAEGEPGLLSYAFHLSPETRQARAVITYTGPEAWIGHHEISFGWPEMQAMHGVARLAEVDILGPFTPEMRAWLAKSPLQPVLRHYGVAAGGFTRPPGRRGQRP
jgi:hypothetical protein